ncbi:MAG: hypothetical protein L7S46_06045 [Candidatus Poseidoniaceae archaeon]|nr:hypothetical protein [Candidatus Poseidoniaceae archaeon]
MTTTTSHLLDALCWTPAAPFIRAIRRHSIARRTREEYDVHRISKLLSTIMLAHGDLLS